MAYLFTGATFSWKVERVGAVRSSETWLDAQAQASGRVPTVVPMRSRGLFESRQEPERPELPKHGNANLLLEG